MKLNIEIRAWMCGLQEVTPGGFLVTKSDVEAFARLIVERCAQECDQLKLQLFDSSKSPPGMDQMRKSCGMGAAMCATDIRNLMED